MARKKVEEDNKEVFKELNINKKEIVEEIKNSVKDELEEEIIKKVGYEASNKLDKMEKRIYRQKRWALIRRDVLIIILLAFSAYEGKILYDNGLLFDLNKKEKIVKEEVKVEENNNDKEEVKEKEEIKKDLNWYINEYGYLLDNIKTNISGEDKYYLYKNNLKADDIKNSVKLNIVYQLLNIESIDGVIRIPEDEIKSKYQEIFGSLDAYEAVNFSNDCINFIYNKDNKSYMAIDSKCNSSDTEIIKVINNIVENNDRIIIEAKVGILDKSKNEISKIDSKETYEYNEQNIDKLDNYQFTFKNKYFYKITKSN